MIELDGVKFYNTREMEEKIKVTVTTIKKYIHSGTLKARKVGRQWYVSENELKRLFEPDK